MKKILPYELQLLVPNYSCLQNPSLGGYCPQIPLLSVLNWICWNYCVFTGFIVILIKTTKYLMTYCHNISRVFYSTLEQNVSIVYALLSSYTLLKWGCTAVLQGPGCTLSCPVAWLCCSKTGWSECLTHLPMNILTCDSYVVSVMEMVGLLWDNTSHNIQFTNYENVRTYTEFQGAIVPSNQEM